VTSTTSERLREAVSDALGYWEPRRVVYNLVLALIVLAYFAIGWPESRKALSLEGVLLLFVLAVLANVCYCAAHLADVFVQVSGFREAWQKWRFARFVIGLAFAAVITRWFVLGFFTSPRVG
jgi:hypothetical protein